MKHMNIRKTLSVAALIGATIAGTTALAADPPQGAYGPGMMGGYGQGTAWGPA